LPDGGGSDPSTRWTGQVASEPRSGGGQPARPRSRAAGTVGGPSSQCRRGRSVQRRPAREPWALGPDAARERDFRLADAATARGGWLADAAKERRGLGGWTRPQSRGLDWRTRPRSSGLGGRQPATSGLDGLLEGPRWAWQPPLFFLFFYTIN